MRRLAGDLLRSLGYEVLEAAHGAEALSILEQHPASIRLLVTDLVMPGGISGREPAQRVRLLRPELRVLYISGNPDALDPVANPGLAERPLLQKPFLRHVLARKVREVLDGEKPNA